MTTKQRLDIVFSVICAVIAVALVYLFFAQVIWFKERDWGSLVGVALSAILALRFFKKARKN
jgi:hypothetical protein